MEPSDQQLLLDTRRGREPAARLLWQRHGPRLVAFAAAIVGSADAEDVVQSVFCGLLRIDRGRLTQVLDPAAWLALLTRRAAINHLRAARRERARRASRAPAAYTRIADDPDETLRHAIDALPRRFREVVVLKHVAGLTFDQIALTLGLNRNTAAGRYRAALDRLRSRLDPPAEANHHPAVAAAGVLHG